MIKIIKHLLSSLILPDIWREALKSLVYFILTFITILYPIYKSLVFFFGSINLTRFQEILSASIALSAIAISLILAFIIFIFLRDNYFYKLATSELGNETQESSNTINQIKSLIRVGFLVFISTIGLIISIFLPILGFLFMSFCFGLEVFSYSFDVKKVGLGNSVKFVLDNFLAVLAIGACCLGLSLIPGAGLVSYPASVRASALYYRSKEKN